MPIILHRLITGRKIQNYHLELAEYAEKNWFWRNAKLKLLIFESVFATSIFFRPKSFLKV